MPPIPVEEEERPPWRLVGKQPRPGPEAREGSKIPLPHGRYDSHGLLEDEPQDDYEPSIAPTDINGALDDGVDPSGLLDDGVELSGLLEDGVDPSGPLEGGDDPSGALDAGNDPAGREIGGSDAGNVDGPAEAAGGSLLGFLKLLKGNLGPSAKSSLSKGFHAGGWSRSLWNNMRPFKQKSRTF